MSVIAPDAVGAGKGSGARYVLKGGVRRVADRIRVTAHPIDADTGRHILAEQIDPRYAETFDLQDDATNRIVAAIAPELERLEHDRAKAERPRPLDGRHLVRSGMALLGEHTREGNLRARELFRDAVKLNPSYGHPRGSLGDFLDRTGRADEGIAMMKDALRLNPNAPNIRHFNAFLARACIAVRRHEEAVHWAKRAIDLKSDLAHAHCLLAVALVHLGLTAQAKRALDRCKDVQPDFFYSAAELSPYENASENKHILDGLLRAGWRG